MKAFRAALLCSVASLWAGQAVAVTPGQLILLLTNQKVSKAASPLTSLNNTFPAGASATTGCWSGQWANGTPVVANPDGLTPTKFTGNRNGFSTAGNTTIYPYSWIVTSRVRQVYPAAPSAMTASTVALSEYVYPTDSVLGLTTTGCDAAPQPVANWGTPHRQVINASITGLEVLAFSRDAQGGSEVAAVGCTATDGSLTSPQAIQSAMSVSSRPDVNPVVDYAIPAIDTSTLAAGLITVNCKVYPWYGNSSTILDSSAMSVSVTNLRAFSPRYFWKTAAAPFNVFVCQQAVASSCPGAGVDATCVVSTTFATANASPCLTFQGAMNKLKTNGAIDNAIIYVSSNTGTAPVLAGPSSTAMTQNGGCLVVTRDPQVTRANAVLGFGATAGPTITSVTNPTGTGCIRFYDMTMKRTAGNTILGNATNPLEIIWDQVNIDDGGFSGTWFNAARADDYIFDATISNWAAGPLATSANGDHRIIRGINLTATAGSISNNLILGSNLVGFTGCPVVSGGSDDGTIIAFSQMLKVTSSGACTIATAVTNGAARVQNVWEETAIAGPPTLFTVSNDGLTNSTANVILQYNTVLGLISPGRSNWFYTDVHAGDTRIQKFESAKGNLLGGLNMKTDQFATNGSAVGNWGPLYGTGFQGTFTQWTDANQDTSPNANFNQAYPGLGSLIGANVNTPQMALAKFTNYQAVTCTGTPCTSYSTGTGGGTYTVTSGTPLKIVSSSVLPFDLAGTARLTTGDSAGAYVAP